MGTKQMSASIFARALTVLAMSMITAASTSAQNITLQPTSPKAETSQEPPGKEVAVEPQAADVQIAKRLEGILEATGWFIAPKVVSREGVVFLDGITRDETHREWATKLAQNTQDVVAVVNKIEVRPEVSWNLDGIQSGLKDIYWSAARSLPLLILAAFVLGISWILAAGVATLGSTRASAKDSLTAPPQISCPRDRHPCRPARPVFRSQGFQYHGTSADRAGRHRHHRDRIGLCIT